MTDRSIGSVGSVLSDGYDGSSRFSQFFSGFSRSANIICRSRRCDGVAALLNWLQFQLKLFSIHLSMELHYNTYLSMPYLFKVKFIGTSSFILVHTYLLTDSKELNVNHTQMHKTQITRRCIITCIFHIYKKIGYRLRPHGPNHKLPYDYILYTPPYHTT